MNINIRFCCTLLILVMLTLSGCSASRIVTSWHDDSYKSGQIKKPMVLAVSEKHIVRARLEDEFVINLRGMGIEAIQSYKYLADLKGVKADAVKAKLVEIGRDSVLVTRLVDTKKESVYMPGTTIYTASFNNSAYHNFSGYYSNSMVASTTPGYTIDYKIYTLESNLYAVHNDKLVWSAVTSTNTDDTDSVDATLKNLAEIISNDLKKSHVF